MAALAFLGTLGLASSFCVIGGSFLGVSEYLIGLIDLHEDCLGPRVLVLVGVVLERHPPEGAPDLLKRGSRGHIKELVIVIIVGHEASIQHFTHAVSGTG